MQKEKAIALIQDTDETRYKINVSISKRFGRCFGCSNEYKVELLKVRQSRKVPSLQVAHKFCPKCVKSVDYIEKHWKGREAINGEILSCKSIRR